MTPKEKSGEFNIDKMYPQNLINPKQYNVH